jgi:hypothetical protein
MMTQKMRFWTSARFNKPNPNIQKLSLSSIDKCGAGVQISTKNVSGVVSSVTFIISLFFYDPDRTESLVYGLPLPESDSLEVLSVVINILRKPFNHVRLVVETKVHAQLDKTGSVA